MFGRLLVGVVVDAVVVVVVCRLALLVLLVCGWLLVLFVCLFVRRRGCWSVGVVGVAVVGCLFVGGFCLYGCG